MSWPSRKRRDLSISEKNDLLKKYDELPKSISQRQAAENLQISQPLLSKLLKNRYDIETSFANNELCHTRKRKRCGKDEDVEIALKEWFLDARREEIRVDGTLLKQKAEELALRMGKEDFQVTNGWFTRWKNRENVTYTTRTHELVEANSRSTDSRLCDDGWFSLISEYTAENIYCAHETALYYRALPEHTHVCTNDDAKGTEKFAERITVLCCVSINGRKKELVVVGRKKEPQSFKGVKNLPVHYYATTTAHMTTAVFSDWLRIWDDQLTRKILLFIDNCAIHYYDSLSFKNIKIVFVPITTSLKPIIHTLKAYYRHEMRNLSLQRAVSVPGNNLVTQISLLDAIHVLAASWYAVTESTIRICFKNGGLLHDSEDDNEMQSVPLPHDLTLNQYDEWMGIDSNLETFTSTEEPVDSRVDRTDTEDDLRGEEYDVGDNTIPAPPSNQEILNSINVLNRAVQYYGEDFELHFSYVNSIKRMIERNKVQTKIINNFFRPA